MHPLLLLSLAAAAPAANAPLVPFEVVTTDDVVRALREHYTKHEYQIPMRDSVTLHTHVWTPKPASVDDHRRWPMLYTRTPYSVQPYGIENLPDPKNPRALSRFAPAKQLVRSGYVMVHQDVRGRLMSGGTFVDIRPMADPAKKRARDPSAVDESTDAWDTIDWLVKHVPNTNGRVGVWGNSYAGFYAAQAAVDAHPALKAAAPMAPVTEWFVGDDFHHNGAFFLADTFSFYANFGRARDQPTTKIPWDFEPDVADVYDFFLQLGPIKNANTKYLHNTIAFWDELLAHPNRDAWWQARDPRPRYRDITPAVLVIGGWFDAEDLWGALHTYASMNEQTRNNRVALAMGPWIHGGWLKTEGESHGDISFGQKTVARFLDEVEVPFFESHLKGDGTVKTPEAFVYLTGANEWRAFEAWPPRKVTSTPLYLGADGALGTAAPVAAGTESFVADPNKPVPYLGGPSQEIDKDYMSADQRFAARRPDVLAYRTAPLAADVTVAGPIDAEVWLSTTGTDLDVVVKLIDIWPEDTKDPEPNPRGIRMAGYQQLVRAEVFRGRFRDSFEKPAPFVPGQPTRLRFALPDVGHTFRAGHRVAVQIQSSWFPLVDSNPQTFVDIAKADARDFQRQTHTIHRAPGKATHVTLPVLDGAFSWQTARR